MTIDRAIHLLNQHKRTFQDVPEVVESTDMAIAALYKQKELYENCQGNCWECKYRDSQKGCANDLLIDMEE